MSKTPKVLHLRAIPPYKIPDDEAVHFLKTDFEQLTFDEMNELAAAPYRDENWVKLAYSVSFTVFQPYFDQGFAGIMKRKITASQTGYSDSRAISTVSSVNCLYFDTSFRSPGTCDWSREFKFFSGKHFLRGIGVYAINLTSDFGKLLAITSIARYYIQGRNKSNVQNESNSSHKRGNIFDRQSGDPFNRMLVAVIKQDKWEIAFVQIKEFADTRTCKVTTTWCHNPSEFFHALTRGMEVKDIKSDQGKSYFDY